MILDRPEAFLLLIPAALLVALLSGPGRRTPSATRRPRASAVLRVLSIACFLAVLAGPHRDTTRTEPRRSELVADRSGSVPSAAADAVEEAAARLGAFTRPFGGTEDSDPRGALLAAAVAGADRVVLATDGRTPGREIALLGDLCAAGAATGVLPLGPASAPAPDPPEPPRIVPPGSPHPGETRPLFVRAPGADRVLLAIDGEEMPPRPVVDGLAEFPDLELAPGRHEAVARAEGPGGGSAAARSFTVAGPLPVLVLAPDSDGPVARALAAQGLDVRAGSSAPASIEARVVVALPGAELAAAGPALVRFVRGGGGLFAATGAPPGLAALEGEPVADLLPVRARPAPAEAAPPPEEEPAPPEPSEPPPEGASPAKVDKDAFTVSVLLVMDRSGSMAGEKILIARASCLATAGTLDPEDRLGVLAFSNDFEWIQRFRPAGERAGLRESISRLAPGGGTEIFPAIREAYREVRKESAAIRHVILVSDGQDVLVGFKPLLDEMRKERITLSAIGIGTDFEFNFLSSLAEWGGGRAYFATRPRELVALVTHDTRKVLERRDAERERAEEDTTAGAPEPPGPEPEPERPPEPPPADPVAVAPAAPLPMLEGLSFPPLPETEPVEPRFPAFTALVTAEGAPVLTLWRHGRGRVAHLAGDPDAWASWPDLGRFLGQIVRHLAGAAPADAPAPEVWIRPHEILVESEEIPKGEARSGGKTGGLAFTRIAPDRWAAPRPPTAPGEVLLVRVTTPDGAAGLAAAVEPPPAESVRGRDVAALARLAAATGRPAGELPPPPEPRRVPGREPLELPFLLAGVLLLVADTAFRRLR